MVTDTELQRIIDLAVQKKRGLIGNLGIDEDDLRQEIWLRLLTRPPVHDTPAFTTRVVQTTIIDVMRDARGRPDRNDARKIALLGAGPIPVFVDPETGVENQVLPAPDTDPPDHFLRQRLARALNTLPRRMASVVWRNVVDGESLTHIAQTHGLSLSWAFQYRERGLKALRKAVA